MKNSNKDYIELEYIEYEQESLMIIKNIKTKEEAINLVNLLNKDHPSDKYKIMGQAEPKIINYGILLPKSAASKVPSDYEDKLEEYDEPLTNDIFIPTVYRFIEEKYIDSFFKTGELLLSTYDRCQELENESRKDAFEGKYNITTTKDNQQIQCCLGVPNSLFLCTSLSQNNILPNGKKYSAAIQINSIKDFISIITDKLIEMGYSLKGVISGPCIYGNRNFTNENPSISSQDIIKNNTFNFDKVAQLNSETVKGEQYFIKPISKSYECEYRIIWLINNFKEKQLIIKAPELIPFCKKINFKI